MDFLVADFEPEKIAIFSTTNQAEVTDQYFYDSASNVSFFFEEKAFDSNGRLTKPKDLAINKVGHGESGSEELNGPRRSSRLRD